MKTVSNFKLLCVGLSFSVVVSAPGQEKTISEDGVSLTYNVRVFSKVEIVELKREALPHAVDQLNVHPANLVFRFYAPRKCAGLITLYPLQDLSVKDLKAAYPELSARAEALDRLLDDQPVLPQRYPSGTPKDVPTIQNQRAGQHFLSHLRYLDFSWGSGVGFLVQYAQDASAYAVGSRLSYQIEGLTSDRKIAVSASFAVAHPDLPPAEKNKLVTNKNGEPLGEEAYSQYLRQIETFLDRKSETTFRPPLNLIQKLVGSLRFENVDPGRWGSMFSGKTIVVD
jgi:hypothetical protein